MIEYAYGYLTTMAGFTLHMRSINLCLSTGDIITAFLFVNLISIRSRDIAGAAIIVLVF